jgi:hypothetical protein
MGLTAEEKARLAELRPKKVSKSLKPDDDKEYNKLLNKYR